MAIATKDLRSNQSFSIESEMTSQEREPESPEELEAYCNEVFPDDVAEYESDVTDEVFEPRPSRGEPVQFPTVKPNRYSKDRRYIPGTKKSDEGKKTGHSSESRKSKISKDSSSGFSEDF